MQLFFSASNTFDTLLLLGIVTFEKKNKTAVYMLNKEIILHRHV